MTQKSKSQKRAEPQSLEATAVAVTLTAKEAALELGVATMYARKLAREGKLLGAKQDESKRWIIPLEAVQAYVVTPRNARRSPFRKHNVYLSQAQRAQLDLWLIEKGFDETARLGVSNGKEF